MKTYLKKTFSIKHLEVLSGVKAHTIRIWEKRYNLFTPIRSETNIRTYTLEDLQKLLNVTFLLQNGLKISKIAEKSSEAIAALVVSQVNDSKFKDQQHAINSFKIAMMNFDEPLFLKTYNNVLKTSSFDQLFYECFLPLLEEIGLLWQTDTIKPSHEHFISYLIKHKLLLNIEKISQKNRPSKQQTFVLFLPENEIHDLGLLYLNYSLVHLGYKVIYLGVSIALEHLQCVSELHPQLSFVTYFTLTPPADQVTEYFNQFDKELGQDGQRLYVLGSLTKVIDEQSAPDSIFIMLSIREFVNHLQKPLNLNA